MRKNIHDDRCYHCGQTLTPEAREHLDKIGGLLARTPEQEEADRKAEAKRIEDLADERYQAKLKENEKTPEQEEAEKKEIKQTIEAAESSGYKSGVRSVQEQLDVKIKEEADMKKQINELKASVAALSNTKGVSGELIGNLQDQKLFDILVGLYPDDEFKDFGIGEPGADILHTIFHNGKSCGSITWESKRMEPHKSFKETEWISKLMKDKLENKSSIAVIVANKYPHKKDKLSGVELDYPQSCLIEDFGYWYCSTIPHNIQMLSFALRQQIIAQASNLIYKDQLSVSEEVMNFVCGEESRAISDKVTLHNSKTDVHRQKVLKLQQEAIKNAVDTIGTLNKYDAECQDVLDLQSRFINSLFKITNQTDNLIESSPHKEPLVIDNPTKKSRSVK